MNNENSNRIKDIIKNNQNCCNRTCIVVGPTGPAGPTGPQGIPGPSGTIFNTFGRKYNNNNNQIALETNIENEVPLSQAGPVDNVLTTTQNKLTITQEGVYLIEYFFSGSSSVGANLTIGVKQNNNTIGSTTITKTLTANTNTDFSGSTINSLSANDQIGISIKSSAAGNVTLGSGTNAFLNIVRIS